MFFPNLLNAFWGEGENKLEEKIYTLYGEIESKSNLQLGEDALVLDGQSQKLYLVNNNPDFYVKKVYPVSTGRKGFGNKWDSLKTPTGIHKIVSLHGEGVPYGTVFVLRRPTKRKAQIYDGEHNPTKFMTSRLVTLSGCESKNKNTFGRNIYIHGTSAEGLIGKPASSGCIRMKNNDVIELFDFLKPGMYLNISKD